MTTSIIIYCREPIMQILIIQTSNYVNRTQHFFFHFDFKHHILERNFLFTQDFTNAISWEVFCKLEQKDLTITKLLFQAILISQNISHKLCITIHIILISNIK